MSKELVLKEVSGRLQKLVGSKAGALPKNFNQTRFLQNCLTVLNDTKGIENMNPRSVCRTMLKGAFLGLDFFNKECYAIPYGKELQFQTDYKGEIKLAKMYSTRKIRDIYAKLVHEGDDLNIKVRAGLQSLDFTPVPFSDTPVIGAFAVVYYEDGGMLHETMSIAEIESVRKQYSKAPNSPAWIKSPGEMQKKTVERRLCKAISLNFDNAEQDQAWEDGSDSNIKTAPYNEPPAINDPMDGEFSDEPVTQASSLEHKPTAEPEPTETAWDIEEREGRENAVNP